MFYKGVIHIFTFMLNNMHTDMALYNISRGVNFLENDTKQYNIHKNL